VKSFICKEKAFTFFNATSNRRVRVRRIALLLLIGFLSTYMFAQFIIIVSADHKCIGVNCPVCKTVQYAKSLVKQTSKTTLPISGFETAIIIMVVVVLMNGFFILNPSTPIKTKVRLNI